MRFIQQIRDTFWALVNDPHDWWQWAAIAFCLLLSLLTRFVIKHNLKQTESKFEQFCKKYLHTQKDIHEIPIFLAIYLWIAHAMMLQLAPEYVYLNSAAMLVTGYCVYKATTIFAKSRTMPKLIGLTVLIIFALDLVGWLAPLQEFLTNIKFNLGDITVDIWKIVTAIAALFALLWIASITSKIIDSAVHTRAEIPPSIQVLIGKAARLLLYISVFLITLKIAGFPLGTLAVFSGALGLGLGFGLQKVISNLVSGVIILLDKSIKPGDVIEINDTYGWINTLRTRYVSVLTRDRKEILIPNEDFITNNVINWSFSDNNVRIRADIGIGYNTDVEKAIELCIEAATKIPRVLRNPAPKCLLMGFGDSSINIQVRFWINDANEGVANVRSQVLLEVWKTFKKNKIEIPFPQREITIKSAPSDLDGIG